MQGLAAAMQPGPLAPPSVQDLSFSFCLFPSPLRSAGTHAQRHCARPLIRPRVALPDDTSCRCGLAISFKGLCTAPAPAPAARCRLVSAIPTDLRNDAMTGCRHSEITCVHGHLASRTKARPIHETAKQLSRYTQPHRSWHCHVKRQDPASPTRQGPHRQNPWR